MQLKKGEPLPGSKTHEAEELDDGERSEELGDATELEGGDEATDRAVKLRSRKQRAEKATADNKGLKANDDMAEPERRAKKIDKRKSGPLSIATEPGCSKQREVAKRSKKRKLEESSSERRKKSKPTKLQRLRKALAAEKKRLKKAKASEKRRLRKERAAEKLRLKEAKEAKHRRQQVVVDDEPTSPENGATNKDKVEGDTACSSEFDLQGFLKDQREIKKKVERVNLLLGT